MRFNRNLTFMVRGDSLLRNRPLFLMIHKVMNNTVINIATDMTEGLSEKFSDFQFN